MRTIPVRRQLIPLSNRNRPGTALNSTGGLYINVHETANQNPGADAEMHADFVYAGGGSDNVSFHFAVDEKEAWQMLTCGEIGYHASDGCDDRATDWGCFASVAIETCVHDWNRHQDAVRANLITLMAMIINGHPSIHYGGVDYKRFSPDRIRWHQQSAWDKKYCPRFMLADGFVHQLAPLTRAELATGPEGPTTGIPFKTRYDLPVRVAPGFNGKIIATVKQGATGTILSGPKTVDTIDWYDVRIVGQGLDGTGWVPASILRTLAM